MKVFNRELADSAAEQGIELRSEQYSSAATTLRILRALRRARWWILCLASLGAVAGLLIGTFSKRIYRAEAVVMPVSVSQSESLEELSGSLGGLAALAGVGSHGDDRSRLALATLKGKTFAARFIDSEKLMPVLFPAKWDNRSHRWKESPPTELEAVRRFQGAGIVKFIEDSDTGFVTIQVDWTDPLQAVDWLVSMVAQVNAELRDQAIQESERNIQFLTAQTEQTHVVAVKVAIDRLIENEMKRLMLAQAQKEYALKFVDLPITPGPKDRIWPRPRLLLLAGAFAGSLLGVLVQLSLDHSRRVQKYRAIVTQAEL